MVIKRRARTNQAKEARREQLLRAALELWKENTFSSFTMSQVASRAGLAKGTTYLYFETKEELLLTLLAQELKQWFDKVNTWLKAKQVWKAEDVAEVLGESFRGRRALIRLISIQASILEYNISFEAALSFKTFLLEKAAHTSKQLEMCLPFLHSGDGVLILQRINVLVLGLGQLSEPSEVVKTILQIETFKPLQVDFQSQLKETLEAMLKGLEVKRRNE